MKIIKKIDKMQKFSERCRSDDIRIGFVPTMGYLHAGHISLIKQARKECDIIILSIFVNPIQFSPEEDYNKYPRDLQRDIAVSKEEGIDVIFNPSVEEMYPSDFSTHVEVREISEVLCGVSRPEHFKGVTTIVTKLFEAVKPHIAYFGQKDIQQVLIIERMVRDLNMDIKIKMLPIVREKDGLALSSRNKYLKEDERKQAVVLYDCIKIARSMVLEGEMLACNIKDIIKKEIDKKSLGKIDYIEIVDLDRLKKVETIEKKALLALAVFIGNTRLIDNTILYKES